MGGATSNNISVLLVI